MRFRHPSGRDLRAVARDLGVDRLVVGTLRQEGPRARIALEIVDAGDLTVTWARSFSRPADQLEALCVEAAAELAGHLGGTHSMPRAPRDPAAYRAYLRGRYFWNKRDHAGLLRAIEAFQEALRVDPDYARAWIGLADSYVLLPWMGPTPDREAYPQARAALARALILDPSSSEVHTTRGNLLVETDWQFAEAERAFRRAIELDPDNATAHQWLGELLVLYRRFDEAVAEMDRALAIDPLNAAAHKQRATVLYHAGRHREALAAVETALELDPAQPYGLGWKGYALIELGRTEEGLAAIRADPISQLAGMEPMLLVQETYAAWRRGDRATVERLWPRIEAAGMINLQPFMMAFAYAMAGRPDDMFAALEAAVASRARMTPYIATGHQFDPYRADPRFVSLMHRLGL
jgi:tetratricopeptide (TPR) repeat protein